jgi:hypothetical protein
VAVARIAQVQFSLKERRNNGQALPVKVIDERYPKQKKHQKRLQTAMFSLPFLHEPILSAIHSKRAITPWQGLRNFRLL